MRRVLALLSALIAAAPAAAGPMVPAPAMPCAVCERVLRVNIVGRRADGSPDDRRGPLARMAPALGLSVAEVRRIRATTGLILCRLDRLRPLGSAALGRDGQTIITAAHVLRDPAAGGAPFPAGTDCVFRSQAEPPEEVPLILDGSQILGSGGRADVRDPNDYAVVRLARPLADPGAVPFPVNGAPLDDGARLIVVSGFQRDLLDALGDGEPIVQEDMIGAVGEAPPGAPRPYFLIGAMDIGGSGGVVLVRRAGVLMLTAVVSSTGDISRNGMPFSLERSSYVRVIGIEGGFLEALAAPPAAPALAEVPGSCTPVVKC